MRPPGRGRSCFGFGSRRRLEIGAVDPYVSRTHPQHNDGPHRTRARAGTAAGDRRRGCGQGCATAPYRPTPTAAGCTTSPTRRTWWLRRASRRSPTGGTPPRPHDSRHPTLHSGAHRQRGERTHGHHRRPPRGTHPRAPREDVPLLPVAGRCRDRRRRVHARRGGRAGRCALERWSRSGRCGPSQPICDAFDRYT